jgi:hypothetical protein
VSWCLEWKEAAVRMDLTLADLKNLRKPELLKAAGESEELALLVGRELVRREQKRAARKLLRSRSR